MPEVRETPQPRLMRAREAAELLCISSRLLWSLTNRGEIPHVRIGRCVRYSESDLAAWLESRRVAVKAPRS